MLARLDAVAGRVLKPRTYHSGGHLDDQSYPEWKRHAYQWNAPTDEPGGPKTQHGANRLAVIGLSALAAAPAYAGARVLLAIPGGEYERGGFTIAWPIWGAPASLAAIRALLSHPKLREPQALAYLGVNHVRVARRISLGKYRNFAYAAPLPPRIPGSGRGSR